MNKIIEGAQKQGRTLLSEIESKQLLKEVDVRLKPEETLIADVSPAVGSHLGPGTVGFAFMAGVK